MGLLFNMLGLIRKEMDPLLESMVNGPFTLKGMTAQLISNQLLVFGGSTSKLEDDYTGYSRSDPGECED